MTAARPVSLVIYSLAGEQVAERPSIRARSGEFAHQWDGRDPSGQLVPPGMYIYRLRLDAEEDEIKTGLLSVVY